MKKQRLIELQEKSENGNAELKDVVEILSELFLTQSQYNKELLASIGDLSAKVNKLQTKINDIAKYTTNEPFDKFLDIVLLPSIKIDISGFLLIFMGVGRQTIIILAFLIKFEFVEKDKNV